MGCFITGSVPFVSHVFSDTQSCNVSLEENLGIQLMVLNYVLGQKLLKNREENLGETNQMYRESCLFEEEKKVKLCRGCPGC